MFLAFGDCKEWNIRISCSHIRPVRFAYSVSVDGAPFPQALSIYASFPASAYLAQKFTSISLSLRVGLSQKHKICCNCNSFSLLGNQDIHLQESNAPIKRQNRNTDRGVPSPDSFDSPSAHHYLLLSSFLEYGAICAHL